MANQSNMLERIGNWFAQKVAGYLQPERVKELTENREYYIGKQKRQLKAKSGQYDDNLTTNLVGLAVDRSTSMLFGGGVEFTVPEGAEDAKQVYLDGIWRANKKEILLHRAGVDGDLSGMAYFKIIPDALEEEDAVYPRLVLLDPELMVVDCNPMDMDEVWQYIFEIKIGEQSFREITRRTSGDEPEDMWMVEKWRTGRGGAWEMDGAPVLWEYPFPPILHIQNLPSVHGIYGASTVAGLKEIQDKYNFTVSNLLKIVRYHSHPKTWGRGLPAGSVEKVSWGADEMIKISSDTGMISNLEMQSDLASSRNIAQDLRQTIFDLARVVDIASITDKVGTLTNFGLRVLYSDALAKNSTRRALYGEGLKELNRRMLRLNDMDGSNDIEWGTDMPADEKEDAALILQDLLAGIASKETASELRGYAWKTYVNQDGVAVTGEEDKIRAEQQANQSLENIALANLFTGREVPR